jgi:serine/threonine protein kinase
MRMTLLQLRPPSSAESMFGKLSVTVLERLLINLIGGSGWMDDNVVPSFLSKLLSNGVFRIELKISEGSYGEVYRVVHKATRQQFALKLLAL